MCEYCGKRINMTEHWPGVRHCYSLVCLLKVWWLFRWTLPRVTLQCSECFDGGSPGWAHLLGEMWKVIRE